MKIDTSDQTYEFFVQEASELLQVLEQGFMTIHQDHNLEKLHGLMRAAHSIKGGAACLDLIGIQTIAHNLENGIRALYAEDTVFNLELEELLLQAFDSLRLPLMEQISTGSYDEEGAIARSQPIFEKLETFLGHPLEEAAELPEMPLAGDMTKFLFEQEVPAGLKRWESLLSHPENPRLAEDLKSLAEVFSTLGNMLNLPEFTAIADTTLNALTFNPTDATTVGKLALVDFWTSQKAILEGDDQLSKGPSDALKNWAEKPQKNSTDSSPKNLQQPQQKSSLPFSKALTVPLDSEVKTDQVFSQLSELREYFLQSTTPTPTPASQPLSLGIRIDIQRLDSMNNLVGELATQDSSFLLTQQHHQETLETLEKAWNKLSKLMLEFQDLTLVEAPVNLELGKSKAPDLLQICFEELSQIGEAIYDIKSLNRQTLQIIRKRQQTLQQVQKNLTETRMFPVESLLNRFPQMIRNLSIQKQKLVQLQLSGTDTPVDKAILEKLYDPLVHLVRNAFDHGIESAKVRKAKGKPEQGTILIRAYNKGNSTYLEIRDDGQGIDIEKIKHKAIEKKLISPQKAAKLSPKQIYEFLFYPNFSTRETVSDLSGRGMGLEAVRRQIEGLKGSISIKSKVGKGTLFTLRLPWSLTITKLIVVQIEGQLFAIPMESLSSILSVSPNEIITHNGKSLYSWQGRSVPLVQSLLSTYTYPGKGLTHFSTNLYPRKASESQVMLLLITQGTDAIALKIDRIVMEQQLTIKPFNPTLSAPSYLYGCTLLGDGRLVPVIDSFELLDRVLQQPLMSAENLSSPSPSPSKTPTILIIDDSLTTRQTLCSSLQKLGYTVISAQNGREGLNQLEKNLGVQAVICDIEMPQMNGFEFLSACRKNSLTEKLPIFMLTSRRSDRYRQLAQQLGANAYLTKPCLTPELIKLFTESGLGI